MMPRCRIFCRCMAQGLEHLKRSAAFVKEKGVEYMDLYGRPLVDIAIDLINGYLFLDQASTKVEMNVAVSGEGGKANNGQQVSMKQRKAMMARRYITKSAPKIVARAELICSGDKSTFSDYPVLVGPVSGGIRQDMLQAVIFDFDGVIADTEPLHLRRLIEVLGRLRHQNLKESLLPRISRLSPTTIALKYIKKTHPDKIGKTSIKSLMQQKAKAYFDTHKGSVVRDRPVTNFLQTLDSE